MIFVKSFKENIYSNIYCSGYGLIIVKDLIDLLGFTIKYNSNYPHGSIFEIIISNNFYCIDGINYFNDSSRYIYIKY